jgi:hypothetical protein
MNSIITWGRYAELFTYDSRTRTFTLPKALSGAASAPITGSSKALNT